MVPLTLVTSRVVRDCAEREQSAADAFAIVLYAWIDGHYGRQVTGFRAAAKALGWQERKVAGTARQLEESGWIFVERRGTSSAVMRIAHNPARRPPVLNDLVRLERRPAKAGHARRPAPSERQSDGSASDATGAAIGSVAATAAGSASDAIVETLHAASDAVHVERATHESRLSGATGGADAYAPMTKSSVGERLCPSCLGSRVPGADHLCGGAFPDIPEATYCDVDSPERFWAARLSAAFPGANFTNTEELS